MQEATAYTALGLVAGAYGAIVGSGGGFVIMPALLLWGGLPVAQSVGTSLCAVFAGGVAATWQHARRRDLDWATSLRLATTAVPGAVLGSLLASRVPHGPFSVAFGALLMLIGVAIARRPANPFVSLRERSQAYGAYLRRELTVRRIEDIAGHRWSYYVDLRRGLPLAFAAGCLSALAGIGGGVLLVPALILAMRLPHVVAVGISSALLAITALSGAAAAAAHGAVRWGPAFALAVGSVAGSIAGVALDRRISSGAVARLLAAGLVVIGLRLLAEPFLG